MGARNYATVEIGLETLADGGEPYNTDNVLYVPPVHSVGDSHSRLAIGYGRIVNRSGGTVLAGFAARLRTTRWRAGLLTGAGAYTADTGDAQDSGDDDFPLEVANDANSGFLVSAADRFNLLAIRVTTASVGGSPVRQIQYPVSGGTWETISNALIASPQGAWGLGVQLIWWLNPPDQVVLESGHIDSGEDALVGLHGIRLRATTAPTTTAAVAGSLSVMQAILANVSVADDATYEVNPSFSEHQFNCGADALCGIISDVSADQNLFHANVRVVG